MLNLQTYLAILIAYPISIFAQSSITEPPAIFYGTVTQSPTTTPVIPTTVEWTAETSGDTATIPVSQIITIESETFYITQIPFETRKLADNTALTPTPNTLEQTSSDSTYTRSAKVDGKNALLPSGKETFTYGTPSMGQIERIDLLIGTQVGLAKVGLAVPSAPSHRPRQNRLSTPSGQLGQPSLPSPARDAQVGLAVPSAPPHRAKQDALSTPSGQLRTAVPTFHAPKP